MKDGDSLELGARETCVIYFLYYLIFFILVGFFSDFGVVCYFLIICALNGIEMNCTCQKWWKYFVC